MFTNLKKAVVLLLAVLVFLAPLALSGCGKADNKGSEEQGETLGFYERWPGDTKEVQAIEEVSEMLYQLAIDDDYNWALVGETRSSADRDSVLPYKEDNKSYRDGVLPYKEDNKPADRETADQSREQKRKTLFNASMRALKRVDWLMSPRSFSLQNLSYLGYFFTSEQREELYRHGCSAIYHAMDVARTFEEYSRVAEYICGYRARELKIFMTFCEHFLGTCSKFADYQKFLETIPSEAGELRMKAFNLCFARAKSIGDLVWCAAVSRHLREEARVRALDKLNAHKASVGHWDAAYTKFLEDYPKDTAEAIAARLDSSKLSPYYYDETVDLVLQDKIRASLSKP